MVIHKKTRLTPLQRKEIYRRYYQGSARVTDLAGEYHVTRPTIYKIIRRGRGRDFSIHSSANKRYRCVKYGLRRLTKIEKALEEKRKRQAKRYNKDYPGQMVHGDTKRLPVLEGQSSLDRHEYLFVAIDDFSRELYAAILTNKSQYAAKQFLEQVLDECSYTIEQYYTDNGKEYKGDPEKHAFMQLCKEHHIEQRFSSASPESATPRATVKLNGCWERSCRCGTSRPTSTPQLIDKQN